MLHFKGGPGVRDTASFEGRFLTVGLAALGDCLEKLCSPGSVTARAVDRL